MAAPIRRVSLQSEIIRYIQHYIEENGLNAGDRLPSQGEFIELMQVSRTALREAFKTLEAEGVVEVKNGRGIFVGAGKGGQDSLQSLIGFAVERERLLEILEARRAMETELMAMVVRQATDAEMDELGRVTAALMEKYRANLQDTQEDRNFHQQIYRMCHNRVFSAMLAMLDEYSQKFWQFPLNIKDPFKASMPYHEELYLALRERNAKKAQRVNNRLLDCVYNDLAHQIKADARHEYLKGHA